MSWWIGYSKIYSPYMKVILLIFLLILQECGSKPLDQTLPNSIYSIKSGKIYVYTKELSMADPKSFVIIGGICHADSADLKCFAKDKYNVYYNGTPLPLADPESFVFLDYGYMKDKSKVYYIYDNKNVVVEGADPSTFEIVGSEESDSYVYTKDKNYVYYDGDRLQDIDAKNFDLKKLKR